MTPREVLALCREKEVKAVDLRFTDFLGAWQHFTIPVGKLEEDTFDDGLGFDGSSIRGWQAINESDMLLVPVPTTAFVDPFASIPKGFGFIFGAGSWLLWVSRVHGQGSYCWMISVWALACSIQW